jgi:hypothetical protein
VRHKCHLILDCILKFKQEFYKGVGNRLLSFYAFWKFELKIIKRVENTNPCFRLIYDLVWYAKK